MQINDEDPVISLSPVLQGLSTGWNDAYIVHICTFQPWLGTIRVM